MEIEYLFNLRLGGKTCTFHLLQNFPLGFGLFGILGLIDGNVFLHTLNLLLLPFPLLHLIDCQIILGFDEGIIISIVVFQFLMLVEVNHVGADVVQKVLTVADKKEDALPF